LRGSIKIWGFWRNWWRNNVSSLDDVLIFRKLCYSENHKNPRFRVSYLIFFGARRRLASLSFRWTLNVRAQCHHLNPPQRLVPSRELLATKCAIPGTLSLTPSSSVSLRLQVSHLNVHKKNNPSSFRKRAYIFLVPGERLELSHRKATASKTVVSTISPPGQVWMWGQYMENGRKANFFGKLLL